MFYKKIFGPVLLLPAALLISGCMKDIDSIEDDLDNEIAPLSYNPTYSVPIGTISYSFEDILPPQYLEQIPDNTNNPYSIDTIIFYNGVSYFFPYNYNTVLYEPVDLASMFDNPEYIVRLTFRSGFSNIMPVDIGVQLSFCDENRIVIDSVYSEGIEWIEKGIIAENGEIVSTEWGPKDEAMDSTKINNILENTSFLKTSLFLKRESGNTDSLFLNPNFQAHIKMALRAELIIPVSD